jgi:HSP20 family protein
MTKIVRWSPSRDLIGIHDEVNRLFDSWLRGSAPLLPAENGWSWVPPVDIRETAEGFSIRMDLPGVDGKDLKLSVHGDVLTVRGERRAEAEEKDVNWHRAERYHGSFERQFQLGAAIQGDKVQAVYKDGVLEIRLPKAESAKPKDIPVEVSRN